MNVPRYFESSDVARTLELVPASVRYHLRRGNIAPVAMTIRGVHLFDEAAIETLRRHLKGRRKAEE